MAGNRGFASLLDDLVAQAAELDARDRAELEAVPTIPFDYLSVAEELHSGRIRVAADVSADYAALDVPGIEIEDFLAEAGTIEIEPTLNAEPAVQGDAAAPTLPSVEPDVIARELGLDRDADLTRVRRRFAFDNHPDRVDPHLRERAEIRMQVANMLIDDAVRKTKR